MDTVALYRKYRSHDLNQLIGQDHVARTLGKALESGRISHAYLFTGPRGTGKTSAARIVARRVNGVEDAAGAVDIIEIDAASNNGVDEIRELREKVHIAPNYLVYKVYIIDEVHMLSGAAFNALLKTLEEPPAHAIFILATTEPHKLPQTITSRTQHFPFHPVSSQTLHQHVRSIAETECIDIDDDALYLLAELSEGSVRDCISLLDQLSGHEETVTVEHVHSVVGIAHHDHLTKLLEATLEQNTQDMLRLFDEIQENGAALRNLMKQLLDITRQYIRAHLHDNDMRLYNARRLLSVLSDIPHNAPNLAAAIEAALLSITYNAGGGNNTSKASEKFQQRVSPAPSPPPRSPQTTGSKPEPDTSSQNAPSSTQEKAEQTEPGPTAASSAAEPVWVKTLSLVKQSNTSLYGLLRNVEVTFEDHTCTLTAQFQFHYRRLMEHHNYTAVHDALKQARGEDITLRVALASSEESPRSEHEAKQADEAVMKQVFDILGGEVM